MFISSEFFDKDLDFGRNNVFCYIDGSKIVTGNTKGDLHRISKMFNNLLIQNSYEDKSSIQLKRFERNLKRLNQKIEAYNNKVENNIILRLIHFISLGAIDWKVGIIKRGFIRFKARVLKQDEAANIIRKAFLKHRYPQKYLLEQSRIRPPMINREEFNRRFEVKEYINSGHQGYVYRMVKKDTGAVWAIKGFRDDSDQDSPGCKLSIVTTSFIYEQGLSPHITKTHLNFKTKGVFDINTSGVETNLYMMELIDGQLEKLDEKHAERNAFIIQLTFTTRLLNRLGVVTYDDDSKNIFYKKITPKDTYNGKRLQRYDFWKYTIGGTIFYIPRPSLLIKMGDYELWYQATKPIGPIRYRRDLHPNPPTVEALKDEFANCPPNALVLDMGSVD